MFSSYVLLEPVLRRGSPRERRRTSPPERRRREGGSRVVHSSFDVLQQFSRIERFHHEIDGTVSKRLLPHVIVVVSSNEDDRHLRAFLPDATLQFKAVQAWQPHVNNHARRSRENCRLQELLR